MKLVDITAHPVRVPLRSAVALRGGSTPSFDNVLVRARTEDGVIGWGEATPRPTLNGESVASVTSAVDHLLAPRLSGQRITGFARVVDLIEGVVGNASARSAVETAALDALGRTLGISCAALLGGQTTSVRCAALLPLLAPDAVVAKAQELSSSHGITAFKLKVGADVVRDIDAARSLRDAFPEAVLLADANGGYDVREASEFLRRTDDLGLEFVEELVPRSSVSKHRSIVAMTSVNVLGDESCSTVDQAVAAIESGCFTGVSIKVGRTGLAGSMVIRDRAVQAGARVQMGFEFVTSLGAAASLAFACAARSTSEGPTEVISFLDAARDVSLDPLVVSEGRLVVPDGPGLGLSIDPDLVAGLVPG